MNAVPSRPPAITLTSLSTAMCWVAWQTENRGSNRLPTKVPYSAHGNMKALADDPATWSTRASAEAKAADLPKPYNMGGIGLELGYLADGLALGGIDLDTCRSAAGALEPWAAEVVDRFDSYTEVSPSGSGIKVFFTYLPSDLPGIQAAMGTEHGKVWKRCGGEHPPAIELYVSRRFFTVTEQWLDDTPITLRRVASDTLIWLIHEAGPTFVAAGRPPAVNDGHNRGSDASRSAIALRIGSALRRAGGSFEEMSDALRTHPGTADWFQEKGKVNGGRELHRIWNRGADAPWPVLHTSIVTTDTLPAPKLPLNEVFPSAVATWIGTAANAADAPPDYVAGALLSAAGGCIGNARWGQPKEGWAEPPVVNVALVGRPSTNKSPALDQVVAPLHVIEADLNEDWQDRLRQYATDKVAAEERRNGWKQAAKTAAAEGYTPPILPADAVEPEPPHKRRLASTDPTVAKAERMSAANPRGMVLVRDELAGWVTSMDKFGSGAGGADRTFWIQAYGGRPWSPDRVKDGDAEIAVPHLTWSVVGGIQPDRLASLLLVGDDDGLTARFLYIWPEPRPPSWSEPVAGLGDARVWLAKLHALPWTPPAPLLLPFSHDAQRNLQDWREEVARLEEGASGLFQSWLGKLPGFAVRLATIFAHLEWAAKCDAANPPETINNTDLLCAVTFLAEYAVPMARRTFGEAALPEAERDARRLGRWLLARKPRLTTLNVRELRRMPNGPGIANASRLMAALEELAALGWVRATPCRDGEHHGRLRNDWTVNPALARGGDDLA